MLVEFASAVDATRCAVEIQREMTQQNADELPELRIEFRIGIHVGDITAVLSKTKFNGVGGLRTYLSVTH
jgi:class 3 adenylate cyclase